MDNVCNRCLFSIPSKVEMAEEQEYLKIRVLARLGKLFAKCLFSEFSVRFSSKKMIFPVIFDADHTFC